MQFLHRHPCQSGPTKGCSRQAPQCRVVMLLERGPDRGCTAWAPRKRALQLNSNLRWADHGASHPSLTSVYTRVYTSAMASRAKIFQNGGSQAVRLPKSCRFPDDQQEVLVHRVGRKVVLEPADEWPQDFLQCLGTWSEEIERPKVAPVSKLRDPFE